MISDPRHYKYQPSQPKSGLYISYMFFLLILIFNLLISCSGDKGDTGEVDSLSYFLSDSVALFDLDSSHVRDVGFLQRHQYFGDLDSMIARGYIRVLVPTNRTHYFLDGARQRGLVYEYIIQFEKYLNQQLKRRKNPILIYCIPVRRDQLLPQLVNGYGDIAAAGLTVTDERLEEADFTYPIITDVNEVVVASTNAPVLTNLEELSGKEVFIRKSSSYFKHIVQLNKTLHDSGSALVKIRLADEYLETEDLLELVNSGNISYTISDDYLAHIWEKALDSIVVYDSIPLHAGSSIAQAIRKSSPKLKEMMNTFIRSSGRGTLLGNIIYKRYLTDNKWTGNRVTENIRKKTEHLLKLFRKYGKMYDLDYIFLSALAYQESKFDQSARSHAGAVGIMQVMPKTAASDPINIKDISTVENNIHAGTKYLRHLMDTYFNDPTLTDLQKMYFTMASYNAGPTRISRLRKKAAILGYDPNQWFDHVELIVAKEVGREPVNYITNILKNYVVYNLIVEKIESRSKALDQIDGVQ